MGEKFAHHVEDRMRLPRGWMDNQYDEASRLAADERALLEKYRQLSPQKKDATQAVVNALATECEMAVKEH